MAEHIERESAVAVATYAEDEHSYDKDPKKPETYSAYNEGWTDACDFIRGQMEGLPSADVAPVRHGRWILVRPGEWSAALQCSECGRRIVVDPKNGDLEKDYPFCHCGAKMDKEV